jgi:hypothetical protein
MQQQIVILTPFCSKNLNPLYNCSSDLSRGILVNIESFLILLSGIAWTIVYIASIRIGVRDKSYAMPFWALALNIAWEFLHATFGFREAGLTMQIGIIFVWFLLDLGLLYTFFRYGRKYFPSHLHTSWFLVWGALGLATAFILQYMFISEFGLWMGAIYSAFLQNLLMSILFIVMLIQRSSSDGQSLVIAISKCIGTLAPTIFMGVLGISGYMVANRFVLVTGGLIFFFDLSYIWLLAKTKQKEQLERNLPGNK